jgi:hypothetical protein
MFVRALTAGLKYAPRVRLHAAETSTAFYERLDDLLRFSKQNEAPHTKFN